MRALDLFVYSLPPLEYGTNCENNLPEPVTAT